MSEIYGLNKVLYGDCITLMQRIPDKSIDMILCDLPYGTTACSWDQVIPFDSLWLAYKRIIKENGAILLFGQQPFVTDLVNSNRKWFRYEWIWEKSRAVGVLNSNRMPLRCHEQILVFYKKLPIYHHQFSEGKPYKNVDSRVRAKVYRAREQKLVSIDNPGIRYPRDVLRMNSCSGKTYHPTQKPVDLLQYFIQTYTDPDGIVLDNCIGSGSTAIAAIQAGRNFIGMEREIEYVNIAMERVNKACENR